MPTNYGMVFSTKDWPKPQLHLVDEAACMKARKETTKAGISVNFAQTLPSGLLNCYESYTRLYLKVACVKRFTVKCLNRSLPSDQSSPCITFSTVEELVLFNTWRLATHSSYASTWLSSTPTARSSRSCLMGGQSTDSLISSFYAHSGTR